MPYAFYLYLSQAAKAGVGSKPEKAERPSCQQRDGIMHSLNQTATLIGKSAVEAIGYGSMCRHRFTRSDQKEATHDIEGGVKYPCTCGRHVLRSTVKCEGASSHAHHTWSSGHCQNILLCFQNYTLLFVLAEGSTVIYMSASLHLTILGSSAHPSPNLVCRSCRCI